MPKRRHQTVCRALPRQRYILHLCPTVPLGVVAEFDDPNIDQNEALTGLLGMYMYIVFSLYVSCMCFPEDDSPYPEVRSAVANIDDPAILVNTCRAWVMGNYLDLFLLPFLSLRLRNYVGSHHTRSKPILLLPLSLSNYNWHCRPIALISHGLSLGKDCAKLEHVWRLHQSRPIHNQGTCPHHHHGNSRIWAILCCVHSLIYMQVPSKRLYYRPTWWLFRESIITRFSTSAVRSFQPRTLFSYPCPPRSMDDRYINPDDGLLFWGHHAPLLGATSVHEHVPFLSLHSVTHTHPVWPANLVTCTLFNTLHSQHYSGIGSRDGVSRERFFVIVFFGGLLWQFMPSYLFQALSYFTWVCWIAPENVVVNQLFGYQSGLGMSIITFDWAQIAYVISPLSTPWWAEANVMAGFVFFFWIVAPIIYYTNTWYAKYMPMSSRTAFDNTGAEYDVTRILTPEGTFNLTAYQEYSPLFLSTTFAISYGLSFASITATITHAILFFRKQIWTHSRRSLQEKPDIHARLMSHYSRVPEWWYGIIFIVTFIFGIISIEEWHSEFPVWGFIIAILLVLVYIIPVGMILAITNQVIGLNVITELIVGYALPGRPVAMMMFKTWGSVTLSQALQFASDFKLGHYMKIPPRTMFWAQVLASIIAATVQLGVQSWMFTNITDMCSPTQKDNFICPDTQVFGTASIIWGVIGPQRQFSSGQMYNSLVWFFFVGVLCPVAAWLVSLKWPNSFIRYIKCVHTVEYLDTWC